MAGVSNLVLDECSDILVLQSEIMSRIRHKLHEKRGVISEEDHLRLKNELHAEKEQHARTQLQLSLTEEKLQLFESEAQILAKQLEREKNTFQNAFGLLKSKALSQSSQADDLVARCSALEALLAKQQEDIRSKDEQIEVLKRTVRDTRLAHKKEIAEMHIQMQQELFIAKHADKKLPTRSR